MNGVGTETRQLCSTVALAAALRQMNSSNINFVPVPLPVSTTLPPMYRIRNGHLEEEAEAASRLVSEVAERMRRLTAAYGEWHDFDAAAYFDLPREFATDLVRVVERVNTVHVVVFTDLLLPSFQQAATFWATEMIAAYQTRTTAVSAYRHFFEEVQPAMIVAWQQLLTVLAATRARLAEDVGFLTTTAATDERMRWQPLWRSDPVAELDQALAPALPTILTLTLAIDFPLPAQRQPGRIRRLRRNRARQRHRSAAE